MVNSNNLDETEQKNYVLDANQCLWPKNVCVPIHNCPKINNQLYRDKLTPIEKNYLQMKQCGFRNGTIFVCCKSSLPRPGVCGPLFQDNRISHGKIANMDWFPWTAVLIVKYKSGKIKQKCGGSLLNQKYVLTSAHCVTKTENSREIQKIYELRLGEWNITNLEPDQMISSFDNTTITADPVLYLGVEKYIIHENYVRHENKNDIALLKLNKTVSYTKYIRPICLTSPQKSRIPTEPNNLYIMGWGKTENQKLSDIKRYAAITYVPKKKCEKIYRENVGYHFKGKFSEEHFCAGGTKDACGGDSGGPVAILQNVSNKWAYFIVGIITYGTTPCGNDDPGVYTKISKYIEWIIQNMEH
ncbi:spaetzle-processing enzyme-like [Condylostylus longicornis]|uniref:spaetzle-processing enzyme-like n=1 Tax=Condylostylus longicornis TaxID=2530218 RepID=UPI00244E0C54|nr:spaetzle-processing enzyme-like [Condylostylus longicornis]